MRYFQPLLVHSSSWKWRIGGGLFAIGVLALWLLFPASARAEGSRDLFPEGAEGSRANYEWRTSFYGGDEFGLRRRTLLNVYAEAGEVILLGSSAVGVDDGNALIYAPGQIIFEGAIGNEVVPPADAAVYNCIRDRVSAVQGVIDSRVAELAGPDTISDPATATRGGAIPDGYVPCFFEVPDGATGIYSVIFYGPIGGDSDLNIAPPGSIEDVPENFSAEQGSSTALWDVTVRDSLTTTVEETGRLFSTYLALFTGGNDRPLYSTIYTVSVEGYRYQVDFRGLDPNGFILYGNQQGFLDPEGQPLYRNVLSEPAPDGGPSQSQNQLDGLQGGARIAPPSAPIFFNEPDVEVLNWLNIPLDPRVPNLESIRFVGTATFEGQPTNTSFLGDGGEFFFTTSTGGTYEFVISRDGVDFDPTTPENAVVRGAVTVADGQPTEYSVTWDGLDNSGEPFPVGEGYRVRAIMRGGEFHFPMLDVENSIFGGPTLRLLNPPTPDGTCPMEFGCTTAYYDDRGYLTSEGIVGEVNGPLCEGSPGAPPEILYTGPGGFDSSTEQRGFGDVTLPANGNAGEICSEIGSFGDTKGLDLWTYFPGDELETVLNIINPGDIPPPPTAIVLSSFTATVENGGVQLNWATALEIDTWGFYIFRSDDGTRASAVQVTPNMILAEGRGTNGASYSWFDPDGAAGASYWLREVELDGTISEYGPFTVSAAPANDDYQVYLPFVARGTQFADVPFNGLRMV